MEHSVNRQMRQVAADLERFEREAAAERIQHAVERGLLPAGARPEDLSPEDRAYFLGE